jgi:hypothetical protein
VSDTSQGPGWWVASDGKWYPPQAAPGTQPPPPPRGTPGAPLPQGSLPQKKPSGCLKFGLIGLGVLLVIVIAATALGGGGDDEEDAGGGDDETEEATGESDVSEQDLYPGRPDRQGEDQELRIGEGARLSGYTATVTEAGFEQSVSEFEDDGYIKVHVIIENRDDKSQPYNLFDWSLQTPGGVVEDPGIVSATTLGSGDLVPGGTVEGDVFFEVGDATGEFYVLYKPDAFDAARGVWQVVV